MKRQDEEKRRVIKERRENGSLEEASRLISFHNLNDATLQVQKKWLMIRVETNSDADFEEEEDEEPEFSGKKVGALQTLQW